MAAANALSSQVTISGGGMNDDTSRSSEAAAADPQTVDRLAALLCLDIDEEWRAGVAIHFAAIARAAAEVEAFELDTAAEPAWRFEA